MILGMLLMLDLAYGQGDAPAQLQGQEQVSKATGATIKSPNKQVTKLSASQVLIETGNDDLLENSSFEHSTFSTGWTLTAGTPAVELTKVNHGKKAYKVTLSAQTLSLCQHSTLYASQYASSFPQGVILAKVASTVSGIYTCSANAGTVNLNNCADTDTTGNWSSAKVPVILGATSNGVCFVSGTRASPTSPVVVGNVTGDVYFDKVKLKEGEILDTQPIQGPRVSYTPTFTNFGTMASTNCWYSQDGQFAHIECTATAGTPLAAEARMSLPTGWTSASTETLKLLGIANGTAAAGRVVSVLVEAGSSYLTFGYSDGGSGALLTKANANAIVAVGGIISFSVDIPITQLRGTTSTYVAPCGPLCADTFTATIAATGVVTEESPVGWLNGNCTNADPRVCAFDAGLITVAMACYGDNENISAYTGITSVSVDNNVQSTKLTCVKTGIDLVASRTIIGTFREVMRHAGVSKPKACYYGFGGASATLAVPTECTTGTCVEVLDSCAAISPPARSSAGLYTDFTIANGTFANSSFIDCDCKAYSTTTATYRECNPHFVTSDNTWSTNSSGGYVGNFATWNATGTNGDAYVSIICKGSEP